MTPSTEAAEPKPKAGPCDQSTWDLTPGWLAIYHAPAIGTAYQQNISLVRPSPELMLVREHIQKFFESIGEITRMTNPEFFPVQYQVQYPDGNAWVFWLPILLDVPPRVFDDVADFGLPETNP